MPRFQHLLYAISFSFCFLLTSNSTDGQDLPLRYATLELFTNTPCPICGSENPGFFSRLQAYEGQYHLISFYPGKPYASCIFYQANIPENTARFHFYTMVYGTPTVVINGLDFRSSGSVSNTVLDNATGNTSWLDVHVDETSGSTRSVGITLEDHVGNSLSSGVLFAVIVEREIMYTAPNGETIHRNVFRKFLSPVNGDTLDMSSGLVNKNYQYTVDPNWQSDQTYVIAWLMNPATKEIFNSGTRFDPGFTATNEIENKKASLQIYPNPVSSQLHIALPDIKNNTPLKIFDSSGRLVFGKVLFDSTPVNIDTGNWPAGSYHAEVIADDRILSSGFQVVR